MTSMKKTTSLEVVGSAGICQCDVGKGCAASTHFRVVEEFNAAELIGAPFDVVLHGAVEEEVCVTCEEVLGHCIPQLRELVGIVAIMRVFDRRRLFGDELRFLRRSLGRRSKEMASVLEIDPSTYSRHENGATLSLNVEKSFRFAVGNGHNEVARLIGKNVSSLLDIEIAKIRNVKPKIRYDLSFCEKPKKLSYEERQGMESDHVWVVSTDKAA